MAARLCSLIGAASVDSCTKERVKYRIGESLRVLYRLTVNGHRHLIAARAFAGPSPRTALRVFPDDRKIEHLSSLRDKPQTLSRVFADTWHHSEGVAYVPEKCATVRCVDREGHTIGYAKMYAAGEGQGVYTTYRELASVCPRVVTPVEYVESHRLLLLDVVPGTRIADLKPEKLIDGFAGLAQTLGSLHSAPIPSHLSRFQRHDIDRLRNCAHVVSTARPDVAEVARELVGDLLSTVPAAEPLVCLHGDVHPKNGIFLDGCVTLIDLDQSSVGSAASDLGSLLALLHYNRRIGLITRVEERELASAFLNAYARVQKLPSPRSLSWHTAAALLSERALRSVNRIRPDGLRQLSQLLDDAREILRTGGVRS